MPLEDTDALLHKTALLAKTRGLKGLEFTVADIGDLYHVYGVNATPAVFLRMLVDRNKRRKANEQNT